MCLFIIQKVMLSRVMTKMKMMKDDEGSLKNIVDFTNEAFKHFCKLHNEQIISGKYLKYGLKVVDKPSSLAVGDFVMVTGAGRPKYGLVQSFISKQRVNIRMLLRRGKKGHGGIGNTICALGNLIHLHTPKKK